ncbi:MAG: flagellin N-terminal helical domain-containing protein [Gammaproteobacteria bacterium]
MMKKFKVTYLAKLLFVSYLSTHSLTSLAADIDKHHSATMLAAKTKKMVATKSDCIVAAPGCILQVSPITTSHGDRSFDVLQICDRDDSKRIYTYLHLKDQIAERKILANQFCDGLTRISDMSLPFSKGVDVADANDGTLLAQTAEDAIKEIDSILKQMKTLAEEASTATYSSTQLAEMNTEFQDLLSEINRVANVTSFNGINLLNSERVIIIPFKKGKKEIPINLHNLTTGSSGLNIANLDILTVADAVLALESLSHSQAKLKTDYASIHASEDRLKQIAASDEVVTTVDLNGDIFEVKQKGFVS